MLAGEEVPAVPTAGTARGSLLTKQVLRFDHLDRSRPRYFVYVPESGGSGASLFVAVHGLSRNACEMARLFSGHCEKFGVVLVAPLFTEAQSPDYQRLGRSGRGPRADAALDAILEEVEGLTGADAAQIHLFGFSGGAQFVHRFTMAHPSRVARAVLASAGWYTFPDARKRFPYGIRACPDLPDAHFAPDEFLQVPITVFVGDQDTTSESLRSTKRVMRQQGATRVERAQKWVAAMQAAASAYHLDPLVSYEPIPGGDHSFENLMRNRQLGDRVFAALFGAKLKRAEGRT